MEISLVMQRQCFDVYVTFSGAQYICVAESTNKGQTAECIECHTTGYQILHVDVTHGETSVIKCSCHLSVTVRTFLSQHRHAVRQI